MAVYILFVNGISSKASPISAAPGCSARFNSYRGPSADEIKLRAISLSQGEYSVEKRDAPTLVFTIDADRLNDTGLTFRVADAARPEVIRIDGFEFARVYMDDGMITFARGDRRGPQFHGTYRAVTSVIDGRAVPMLEISVGITPTEVQRLRERFPDQMETR